MIGGFRFGVARGCKSGGDGTKRPLTSFSGAPPLCLVLFPQALTRVIKHFPKQQKHGRILAKLVANIKDTDPREDLKTSAGRVLAQLQAAERNNEWCGTAQLDVGTYSLAGV